MLQQSRKVNHIGKRKARNKINVWIAKVDASDINCFNSFIVTLKKYKIEIIAYFKGRNTSGFVEGFNNKVKCSSADAMELLTKTACFGACF